MGRDQTSQAWSGHAQDASGILKVVSSLHFNIKNIILLICVPLKVKMWPVFQRNKPKCHPSKPVTLPFLEVLEEIILVESDQPLFNPHVHSPVFVFIYKNLLFSFHE